MNKILISFLFIIVSCANPLWAEQTQFQLNKESCDQLKKSDDALNQAYKQVLAKYADDSTFLSHFVTAQKKWLAFRDSYLASKFMPESRDDYGSVLSMCECNFLDQITTDRTRQLLVWVNGIEEGDVCVGTVKVK